MDEYSIPYNPSIQVLQFVKRSEHGQTREKTKICLQTDLLAKPNIRKEEKDISFLLFFFFPLPGMGGWIVFETQKNCSHCHVLIELPTIPSIML